jgi:hypothetical protein
LGQAGPQIYRKVRGYSSQPQEPFFTIQWIIDIQRIHSLLIQRLLVQWIEVEQIHLPLIIQRIVIQLDL